MRPSSTAKIYDWTNSTVWFDENGILCSISKKIAPQTMEEAMQNVIDLKKIIGDNKVCLLADVTHSSESTREVRNYAAIELPKMIKAMAMISESALGKMLANLFFSINSQPYPLKMFNDEEEAKEWLKQFL